MNLANSHNLYSPQVLPTLAHKSQKEIAETFALNAADDLSSVEFLLLDLPLHLAAVPNRPTGQLSASAADEAPIVVDMNKKRVGMTAGGFVPPIVVVDGKKRHTAARAAGRERVKAWVGVMAAQYLGLVPSGAGPQKGSLMKTKMDHTMALFAAKSTEVKKDDKATKKTKKTKTKK